MRLLKVMMMTVVAVCVLAANGFAYSLPGGETGYFSMNKAFVWHTWSELEPAPPAPADSNFLKFDTGGSVTGYKPVASFGGDLSFMAGGPDAPLTSFMSSIDFSNYSPSATADMASFGLEFSWQDTNGDYSGIGVYRGTVRASADPNLSEDIDGYAVSFWSDSPLYNDQLWLSTTAGEADGSLYLSMTDGSLEAKFMLGGGTWESFALIDIAALGWTSTAMDQVLGISGEGTDVDFSNFDSNPPAPMTAPATTPIPGAVWLLGSGLVGLAGFRKRFQG